MKFATCINCGHQTTEEDLQNGGGGRCLSFYLTDKPLNRSDVRTLVNGPHGMIWSIVGVIEDGADGVKLSVEPSKERIIYG